MKIAKFRKWLACLLSPELALSEARLFRLRSELSDDQRWLGYDFPEIDIYVMRALIMDRNFARSTDERPIPLYFGGAFWGNDISKFRDDLRSKFKRGVSNGNV